MAQLEEVVQGQGTLAQRTAVRQLFIGKAFDPPHGLSAAQRHAWTYDRASDIIQNPPYRLDFLSDRAGLMALLEAAAVVDPVLFHVLSVHYCLIVPGIQAAEGNHFLREAIRELETGETFGAMVITEQGTAASQNNVCTQAIYLPEKRKFIINTPDAAAIKTMANVVADSVPKLGVVFAQLMCEGVECGAYPFVVRLRDKQSVMPGVHIEPLSQGSILPVDFGKITFFHVEAGFDSWISGGASITPQGVFVPPAVGKEQQLVNFLRPVSHMWESSIEALTAVSHRSIAIALEFVATRQVFGRGGGGRRLLEYQNVHRNLLTALAHAYAAVLLARVGAGSSHREANAASSPWAAIQQETSATKVFAVVTAERVLRECRRGCGSLGTLADSRFTDYEGLVAGYHGAAGDTQLIILDIARILVENPPDRTRQSFPVADIRESWLTVLSARERYLRAELAARIQSSKTWDEVQSEAMQLGWSHVEFRAATAFSTAKDLVDAQLDDLATVFALDAIHKNSGWYVARRVITPEQALAIPGILDSLSAGLASNWQELTEAFDIPTELTRSQLCQ
jgi:acyl-CoA oxidase